MDVDPYGRQADPQFWSGSDAAVRLRGLPAHDMAMRELSALASRRSTGLNAPRPWVAEPDLRELADAWEPDATGIHFSQVPIEHEGPASLWSHYGMVEGAERRVVTGYYTTESERPAQTRRARAADGAPGTWYAWSTLTGWELWPRRQDTHGAATRPESGRLLLFVSHRWESLEHPDPSGSQLLCLKVG